MERVITSGSHPLVRRARALLRDSGRREEERCLVAEGVKLAMEALESAADVEYALVSSERQADPGVRELIRLLEDRKVPCSFVAGAALAAAQDATAPQGVALIVRMPEIDPQEALRAAARPANDDPWPLVAVVWQVQDPGNVGAIVRVAEATGARAVISLRGGADPFHPRAVRGSAGSVLRVPILRAEDPATLPERLRGVGLSIAAAVPEGGTPYDRADLTGPLAIVFGNEGSGLPSDLGPFISRRVTIPMQGGVRSLNVAVSAALLLFEAARQRKVGPVKAT